MTKSSISSMECKQVAQGYPQESLVQIQKIDSLGFLSLGIVHDLNNLLAAIGFLAGHLQNGARFSDNRVNYLKDILSMVDKGRVLTNYFLNFLHKRTSEKKPLSINSMVAETVHILQRTVPKKISLSLELGAQCSTVKVDHAQLIQVLMNLCINSVQAIDGEGEILISTRNISFNHTDTFGQPGMNPGDFLELQVEDSGKGMDELTRERVFEPFFTTKDAEGGTGLGLSLVRHIVEDHEGFISIDSELNKGTIVRLFLPIQDEV